MQYRLHCVILYSVILHHVVKITSFHINDSRISLQALPLPSTEGTDLAYTACSNQKYWVTTTLNTQHVYLVVVVFFYLYILCISFIVFEKLLCLYWRFIVIIFIGSVFIIIIINMNVTINDCHHSHHQHQHHHNQQQ